MDRDRHGAAEPFIDDVLCFFPSMKRFEETAFGFRGEKPELQGLTPQSKTYRKIRGGDALIADIHDPVSYLVGGTEKKHALAPPVGEKKQVLAGRCGIGEYVAKYVAQKIRFDPAKLAGKKAVGFFQSGRSATLGALILYAQTRAFHRTCCKTWNPAYFRGRTLNRPWRPVFLQPDGRTASRILHWAPCSCRSCCTG